MKTARKLRENVAVANSRTESSKLTTPERLKLLQYAHDIKKQLTNEVLLKDFIQRFRLKSETNLIVFSRLSLPKQKDTDFKRMMLRELSGCKIAVGDRRQYKLHELEDILYTYATNPTAYPKVWIRAFVEEYIDRVQITRKW